MKKDEKIDKSKRKLLWTIPVLVPMGLLAKKHNPGGSDCHFPDKGFGSDWQDK